MANRVAIYARKSVESDKGDSINNQINKCKNIIKGKAKEGEEFTITEYKDEGYTGANTFRPDFQRLLRDIDNGKIDTLICYRLDRITRSVADFSDIDKRLRKHDVNFISISENFDTSTPMGKAMLGIVIVFAQLERETISERITGNMYEMAKTERWVSGEAPFGYKRERFEVAGTKKKQTRLVIR
jgi:DNA invertase Pin-like site-specific DNA recombinase